MAWNPRERVAGWRRCRTACTCLQWRCRAPVRRLPRPLDERTDLVRCGHVLDSPRACCGLAQVLDSVFMSAIVLLGGFWAVAGARPGVLRNRPQPPSPDEARLTPL